MLVLGGLPLLAYPMVLLAGVMSLAAEQRGNPPVLLVIFSQMFLWCSLIHPLVYAGFLGGSLGAWFLTDAKWLAFWLAAGSLIYCVLLVLMLGAWFVTEMAFGTG